MLKKRGRYVIMMTIGRGEKDGGKRCSDNNGKRRIRGKSASQQYQISKKVKKKIDVGKEIEQ